MTIQHRHYTHYIYTDLLIISFHSYPCTFQLESSCYLNVFINSCIFRLLECQKNMSHPIALPARTSKLPVTVLVMPQQVMTEPSKKTYAYGLLVVLLVLGSLLLVLLLLLLLLVLVLEFFVPLPLPLPLPPPVPAALWAS